MRHPHLDFPVPATFVKLLDWLLEDFDPKGRRSPDEHADRKLHSILYELGGDVLSARAGKPLTDTHPHGELGYDNWPLEIIPFSANGGGGLMYAWALLAPELELAELPCVSFAPGDDGGAVWLGDTTKQALETMLVGRVRGWEYWKEAPPPPQERPEWRALCTALDLAPDLARTDVKAGARVSGRKIAPSAPGYRFVLTNDGVGVLAPESAFDGDVDEDTLDSEEATLSRARSYLDAGHPASALVTLKQGCYDDTPRSLIELMREVHGALGRPALVRRADAWLAEHA